MPDSNMSDSNEVERRIRKMLTEMGDEEILADLAGSLKAQDERDRMIDEVLEEMLAEVDDLLLRIDDLEEQPHTGEGIR
jgi:hypothetical protein